MRQNTTYALVITFPQSISLERTLDNGEASGGATGWSIEDTYDFLSSGDWDSSASNQSFVITVRGTSIVPAVTNAAPVITTTSPQSVAENTTAVATLAATDTDMGDTLVWSKNGGADADKFGLTSAGVLTFVTAPDFENPTDTGADNGYEVTVQVSDGTANVVLPLAVNVTDVDEQPAKPAAPTVGATSGSTTSLDVRWAAPALTGGPALTGYNVQYRAGSSGSWIAHTHSGTGTTTTIASLTADTAYQARVQADNNELTSDWSDPGSGSTSSPDNAAPGFNDGADTTRSVDENTPLGQNIGAAVSATDADNDSLNYALSGTDAGSFSINRSTGQLRTRAALNHKAKDSYLVTVSVSDGRGGTDSINVTIEVADVEEAPSASRAPSVASVAGSDTSLMVTWSPPSNTGPEITSYDLRYREGPGGPWIDGPQNQTGTSATITGLNPDTLSEVEVQVRANNAEGIGEWSAEATRTPVRPPTTSPPSPRTSVPGAPTNLTAVGGDGQAVLSWDAPASDGGTAITDYEYRINRSDPWISIGSTGTTYTVTGLVNGTVYIFEVRAVNRRGRSRASDRAEATPDVFVLDFTHFANGDGITSDGVFVNVGTHPIRPTLYFYDKEGHPMAAESVVDITGDLEIREDGGLTVLTGMEPLGELTVSTHGRGDLVTGSVKVIAFGAIGGGLRFDLPGIGVAGVGASSPVRDAIFPARRRAGGISTAAAVHNTEEEAIMVTCRLMKEGLVLEEEEILLEAGGQDARFIEELFTTADTSDFVGSVRCNALDGERFTGLAVELDSGNRIFTTLPVFPVSRRSGSRAAILDFAHFANGDGIISDLVLVNVQTQPSGPPLSPFHQAIPPIHPVLYFYDKEGHLIAPESVVDITGGLEITQDGGLTVLAEMEPLGELTISTHGRGDLVTGSVKVAADGPIGGVLRFDLPGVGVAGVGTSSLIRDALFPARRQVEGISTAAALHNLEEEAIVVTCRLMQGGAVLEEEEIPLEPGGQHALFIEEMFTTTDTSDFVGSVRCTALDGERFTGVAVELDAGNRIFTTLPVVPVEGRIDQE